MNPKPSVSSTDPDAVLLALLSVIDSTAERLRLALCCVSAATMEPLRLSLEIAGVVT